MTRHPVYKTPAGPGRQMIGRRGFLRLAALALGGAVATLAGRPAAAQNRTKQQAAYQNSPRGGQRCADCRYFNAGSRTCQIVQGEISPNGWCRFFSAAGGGSMGGY